MKKTILLVLATAVIATAVFMAWPRPPASPADDTMTVKAVEAPITETVDVPGWVAPYHRVMIRPNTSGRIDRLLAVEGQHVTRGQIMGWMSSTDRASILDAARWKGAKTFARWSKEYTPTPIVAPVDGMVLWKHAVEGQTVDYSTVLYAVSDTLIVNGHVDEMDIGKVHVGMPARVTIDAFPDKVLTGKIFTIRYEGWKDGNNVLLYSVRVMLDDAPDFLRSQMSAEISFISRTEEKALVIPAAAVRTQDGVEQVLVKSAKAFGGEAWRVVRTGIEDHGSVQIVAGLRRDEQVVIRSPRYLSQDLAPMSPLIGSEPTGLANPSSGRNKPHRPLS